MKSEASAALAEKRRRQRGYAKASETQKTNARLKRRIRKELKQ